MEKVKTLNNDNSFWGLNNSYQSILVLDKKLTEEGIPHELWRLMDGWKIAYPTQDDCIFDVIEHRGSYGHELDLMEACGGYLEDVEGYLTVERAFEMFKKVYQGGLNEQL